MYPLPGRVTTRATTTLGEVRRPRFPSVLLEIGYHDNYADARWVEGQRKQIAAAIARGLAEYFGLPFAEPLEEAEEGTVEVRSGTLNLRDYPSREGRIIAALSDGAAVTVYGLRDGWATVHYDGLVGYAAAAFIDI